MVDRISNKAITPKQRQIACNAARRCFSLSREEELSPMSDAFRKFAEDLLVVAESGLSPAQRVDLQRKIDALNMILEACK